MSPTALKELEDYLANDVDSTIGGGEIRIMFTPLPGRASCVAVRIDGVTWLLLDDGKPWPRGQVAEMLADHGPANHPAIEAFRLIPQQGGRRLPLRLEAVS